MKLENLPIHEENEKFTIRYNEVDKDTIFYYAHIKDQECSATPYDTAALAIEWAENETR